MTNNKFRLIRGASFIIFLFLCVLPVHSWAQGIVCITSGDSEEQSALEGTLTNLGYTIRITTTPSTSDCQVYVSYPGGSGVSESLTAWVQAGHGIVQISDWGPDLIPNTWTSVSHGTPQTIEVIDPSHPIAAGLPVSWTGTGFWYYGGGGYIGWDTNTGDPNLIRAGGYDRALSARAEGSGRLVYIGWNVYGSAATANDVQVLQQAITWAGAPAYEVLSCVGAICYYSCTIGSCPASHCTINIPGLTGCMNIGQMTYCGCTPPCSPSSCSVFVPQQER